MARKTVLVEFVRETVNRSLAQEHVNDDERRALCYLVERVLMETGNYKGFRYLDGWPTDRELARHYF